MNNYEILEALNKKVKGHEKAKKVLLSVFNKIRLRHYQMTWELMDEDSAGLVRPQNVLLIGKSGTGKTYLVEQLSRILHIPIMTVDATQLNQTGSRGGKTLEELIKDVKAFAIKFHESNKSLYPSVDGVLSQMVVFVDEFDKLCNTSGSGWMRDVQSNFLRLFEGKADPALKNITFICAGAFMSSSIYDKKEVAKEIGFFKSENKEVIKDDNLDEKIIEAGILPELAGRIGSIIKLDDLTKDDYKHILTQLILPNRSVQLAHMCGVKLELSDEEVASIVDRAFDSAQGIRAMTKAVDDKCIDLEFDEYKFDSLRL